LAMAPKRGSSSFINHNHLSSSSPPHSHFKQQPQVESDKVEKRVPGRIELRTRSPRELRLLRVEEFRDLSHEHD
jgi:hypothetical protein